MDNLLKEIRERLGKATPGPWINSSERNSVMVSGPTGYSDEYGPGEGVLEMWDVNDADFIANSPADMQFLLDALEQSQEENKQLKFDLYDKTHLVATACHALKLQKQKLDKLQETYTDENGTVWETPTSWAYASACKALHKHHKQERVLREALSKVESMDLTGELFGQKVYSMFADDRDEILKALKQEDTK